MSCNRQLKQVTSTNSVHSTNFGLEFKKKMRRILYFKSNYKQRIYKFPTKDKEIDCFDLAILCKGGKKEND